MGKAVLSVAVVAGIVAAVLVFKNKNAVAPENGSTGESPVFCTQDAKQCPDGSYVGRQGPNCEFAACPAAISPSVSKSANPSANPSFKNQTLSIIFANGSAVPNKVTIRVGDTVMFVNNDTAPRWPASGMHPTHLICPGFDSLRGLNTGESYSFTFREAKTCPWHDHLKPSINGQIVIQ